jgi:hypothetical protein
LNSTTDSTIELDDGTLPAAPPVSWSAVRTWVAAAPLPAVRRVAAEVWPPEVPAPTEAPGSAVVAVVARLKSAAGWALLPAHQLP